MRKSIYIIILLDAEKAFDKMQYPLMIFQRTENRQKFSETDKKRLPKNIILNNKPLQLFSLKPRTR